MKKIGTLYNKAKNFIGEKAFYLKEEGVIKDIRKIDNMVLSYLDNGIVVNFILLKNEKGVYFEDIKENKEEEGK